MSRYAQPITQARARYLALSELREHGHRVTLNQQSVGIAVDSQLKAPPRL